MACVPLPVVEIDVEHHHAFRTSLNAALGGDCGVDRQHASLLH
jgi:hypothetical protein